mmetsp:Transcript_31367/g.67739  ORF Transcript_31367/g.67739 Transcript_31367/m.67739 type:complete len:195 (-) Transcript_31367:223-807(-)
MDKEATLLPKVCQKINANTEFITMARKIGGLQGHQIIASLLKLSPSRKEVQRQWFQFLKHLNQLDIKVDTNTKVSQEQGKRVDCVVVGSKHLLDATITDFHDKHSTLVSTIAAVITSTADTLTSRQNKLSTLLNATIARLNVFTQRIIALETSRNASSPSRGSAAHDVPPSQPTNATPGDQMWGRGILPCSCSL